MNEVKFKADLKDVEALDQRVTALEEGGGGGGLPVPTAADLGKAVGVVLDPTSPGETVLLLAEQDIVLTTAAVTLNVDANVFFQASYLIVTFEGNDYTVYKNEDIDFPSFKFYPSENTTVTIYYSERTLRVLFNVETTQEPPETMPGTYQLKIMAHVPGVTLGFIL